jgi:hypothetical protein
LLGVVPDDLRAAVEAVAVALDALRAAPDSVAPYTACPAPE